MDFKSLVERFQELRPENSWVLVYVVSVWFVLKSLSLFARLLKLLESLVRLLQWRILSHSNPERRRRR